MLKSFREKGFYYPFLIWILIVFWYSIFAYSFFDVTRRKTQDYFNAQAFYLFPSPAQVAKEIVIVAIDEASRRQLNLKWPWPRSTSARLIRNIASFSPKVIGLDIVFSGKSREDEDKELAAALKTHPGIILGYKLGKDTKDLPLPAFRKAAGAIGFINKPVDESKILRNTRTFYVDREGNVDFSIDIELIANYLTLSHRDIEVDTERGLFLGDKLFIPSKKGITSLNYLVHPNHFYTIPAYLVLDKKVNARVFKDKIVLVGATDPLIHDEYFTPLGISPGVAAIANSLTMMLNERFIRNLSRWQFFLIVLILGVLILLINKNLSFGLSSFLTFSLLGVLFVALLYLRSKDIQGDYFSIFFLAFFSYIVSISYKYSYLVYMRNKLRDLAIKDPLTGFFTLRYFLLSLDEKSGDKSKSLTFLAVVISNYRRLTLDLTFEELKTSVKLLAEALKSKIEKKFKKAVFSRLSQDIIGVAVWGQDKEQAEGLLKELLQKLKKVEFTVEEKIVKFSLNGILFYKPKGKRIQGKELIYNMHSLLRNLKKEPQRDFVSLEVEEVTAEAKKEPLREDILDFLTGDLEERNKDLERTLKELSESKKETEGAYFEVIRSLVKALEEKDTFTQGHSERVANYAKQIAGQLALSDEEASLIYNAALLHDIGKIGLPDYLLHKKGKLSEEDIGFIRKHEIISVEILKPIKAFKDLLPIILHHHEHFDGSGYPHGLSGDMIPKGAQILAVADAFDAITSGRGYKKGKSIIAAIEELEKHKEQFNPFYIECLKKILKI